MKELEYIEIIKNTLTNSSFIGNDCADLQDIGLFITQDSLVEGVHFTLATTTPYQLGQKAVAVNISDLATTLCIPEYISVGLSVPNTISNEFIKEFYKGIDCACQKYHVIVTGGDITAADKVYISITALGRRRHSINTGRNFAKEGDFIISTGFYGTSAAGLYALQNGINVSESVLSAHLTPEAKIEEAHIIGNHMEENLAVMDTSDGLADALYKIAKASNVSIDVNFDDIPILPEVKELAQKSSVDIKDWALWGGEDFEILFSVPYHIFSIMDITKFKYIGNVIAAENNIPIVTVNEDNGQKTIIDENLFRDKSYNHFGG